MDIYVVQPNDNIYSIANHFGVSVTKLIQDNELKKPDQLVTGQTIVIVYPEQTYTVQDGDTLQSISEDFGVSIMQLLRNNPFLSNHSPVPNEVITISYNTSRKIITNGFVYPYINIDTLKKTLPYLTYISIYNYRVISNGEIISYLDDSSIIQMSKIYGTIPLMMLTTSSAQGEPDIEAAYKILLSDELLENHINNILTMVKAKGYLGVNLFLALINESNQKIFENFVTKAYSRLKNEGYYLFITINPYIEYVNNESSYKKINYSNFAQSVDGMTFLKFTWGTKNGPPMPINSINQISSFLDYSLINVPSDHVSVGYTLVSYDWKLPYVSNKTSANSLSINSSLDLARIVGATIQFDDLSQSPFFVYKLLNYGVIEQHIVWSVDARSILALANLILELELNGAGLWNLMTYYAQLWLVINSQFEIEKPLPETIIL